MANKSEIPKSTLFHAVVALLDMRDEDDKMANERAPQAGENIDSPNPPAAHLPSSTNASSHQVLDTTSPDEVLASVLLTDLSKKDAKVSAKKDSKLISPKPTTITTRPPPTPRPGLYPFPPPSRLCFETTLPGPLYSDIEYQVMHGTVAAPPVTESLPRVHVLKFLPGMLKTSLRARDLLYQAMQFTFQALDESGVASMLSRLGRTAGIDVKEMKSDAHKMVVLHIERCTEDEGVTICKDGRVWRVRMRVRCKAHEKSTATDEASRGDETDSEASDNEGKEKGAANKPQEKTNKAIPERNRKEKETHGMVTRSMKEKRNGAEYSPEERLLRMKMKMGKNTLRKKHELRSILLRSLVAKQAKQAGGRSGAKHDNDDNNHDGNNHDGNNHDGNNHDGNNNDDNQDLDMDEVHEYRGTSVRIHPQPHSLAPLTSRQDASTPPPLSPSEPSSSSTISPRPQHSLVYILNPVAGGSDTPTAASPAGPAPRPHSLQHILNPAPPADSTATAVSAPRPHSALSA
jgi:hypothetical protein